MPKAAVDGLVIIAGNVLLVKRKKKPFKSHLALPGGFLQPYESYEHALKREVKEETGIDADIINIIGAYSSKERDERDVASVAYLCKPKHAKHMLKKSNETMPILMPLHKAIKTKLAFDHNKILVDGLNVYVHYLINIFLNIGREKRAPVLFIDKGDDFQRLVFIFLSARTRDDVTYSACKRLFEAYKNAEQIANADEENIANLIKPVAFYKQKAKHLIKIAKYVNENGIPKIKQELLKLPGIGIKTTNVFLAEKGMPYIGVDTHVHRLSNRLGIVNTNEPKETEKALYFLNDDNKKNVNLAFVAYGQTICKAIKPLCDKCPVSALCKYSRENKTGFWSNI
ncbi:MAG: NUDIX domain-containing protein [Candidatus Anstonellales archaeon]